MADREYQKRGVEWIVSRENSAVFARMGYGKTYMALKAINALMWDHLKVQRTLVLAPKRVAHIAWPEQIKRWAPDLKFTTVFDDKERELRKKVDVYLVSYSTLPWLYKEVLNNPKGLPRFDFVILDESTFIKHDGSNRTQIVKALLKWIPRKLLLAGKPAPNGLLDFWSQIHFLDGGARLGRTFDQYKRERFIASGSGMHKRYSPMKGTQEWVAKALSDIAFTLTSSDELNLPKLIENDIVIQLAPSLMKRYKRLEDKSTIDFSDVTLSANSASALSMKVRQFTQGFMYDDDGVSRGIHQEKYEALKSIIENNEGDNILCPVQFIEDIKFLQRMIPGTPAIYSGTSDKDTARYLEQWNKGEIPLLLIHPASVSHGLNLQSGGHTIIWYALTWDLDHYEQVIARLLRSGQIAKSVVVHHLICKDTIDELIIQAIRRKAKVQDKTLNTMEVLQNGKEKAYAN